jgi:hypothetical protein
VENQQISSKGPILHVVRRVYVHCDGRNNGEKALQAAAAAHATGGTRYPLQHTRAEETEREDRGQTRGGKAARPQRARCAGIGSTGSGQSTYAFQKKQQKAQGENKQKEMHGHHRSLICIS